MFLFGRLYMLLKFLRFYYILIPPDPSQAHEIISLFFQSDDSDGASVNTFYELHVNCCSLLMSAKGGSRPYETTSRQDIPRIDWQNHRAKLLEGTLMGKDLSLKSEASFKNRTSCIQNCSPYPHCRCILESDSLLPI